MKLSIVIPVYNVERYIKRCVESVMSQDTSGFDAECLLIDDCTPDDSMAIAREAIAAYEGAVSFTCLRHERNKGLSEARNTGMRSATGDRVLFVDSDDYLLPGSLATLMAAVSEHPDADIVMGNVYEHKYKKNQYDISATVCIEGGTAVRRWMLTNEFAISAWNKVFHRRFLVDNGLFFEPGILYEDIPWNYRLYALISKVVLVPQVTYGYWYNEQSISSSSQPSDKAVRSFTAVCRTLMAESYERELYVPRSLFVYRWLLNGINARHACSSASMLSELYAMRGRFMRQTLADGRLVLATFYLLMYQPLNAAFGLRWFRRYYNQMSRAVARTAQLFDRLHR